MWSKVLLLLALVYPSAAWGGEGKFSLVPRNGIVKFNATCFDDEATAKILTFSEFIAVELNTTCIFEKDKMLLEHQLELDNLLIEKTGLEERYLVETTTRDNELEELRKIIKKNKKLNIPVVIATSVAVGFGVGFGTYHIARK